MILHILYSKDDAELFDPLVASAKDLLTRLSVLETSPEIKGVQAGHTERAAVMKTMTGLKVLLGAVAEKEANTRKKLKAGTEPEPSV